MTNETKAQLTQEIVQIDKRIAEIDSRIAYLEKKKDEIEAMI